MESDLSVFHRIDDIETLTAQRFFMLATRLFAYEGALRYTAQREREEAKFTPSKAPNRPTGVKPTSSDGKTYHSDIKTNPELAQYFD